MPMILSIRKISTVCIAVRLRTDRAWACGSSASLPLSIHKPKPDLCSHMRNERGLVARILAARIRVIDRINRGRNAEDSIDDPDPGLTDSLQ
jgi:hypothetical protein